jgi:hypothetical protein
VDLAGALTTTAALLRTLGGWCLVVLAAVSGMLVLATSVEGASRGSVALALGALSLPGLLVLLAPALVGAGVALGAARMDSRGERVALEACGQGPLRTAPAAALLGLCFGVLALLAADHLVPRAEALARSLRGAPPPSWVWVEEGAVRLRDDLLVRVEAGRIAGVDRPAGVDPARLERHRALQDPRTAPGAWLADSSLAPARLERLARRARLLSALLLALLAWLPTGRGPASHLGRRLLLAVLFVAFDQSALAVGAQGRLAPALAAFAAPAALLLRIGWELRGALSPRPAPTTRRS